MPEVLTLSSSVKLMSGAGWSWRGWDGVVALDMGLDTVLASDNAVVLAQHLILALSQVAAKPYEAIGFADVPGIIANIVPNIDPDTLAQTVKAGSSRVALSNTTGTFTATVGLPSHRMIPSGPIPDPALVKVGTWKIEASAQGAVRGT
jgi:hypothetical protein